MPKKKKSNFRKQNHARREIVVNHSIAKKIVYEAKSIVIPKIIQVRKLAELSNIPITKIIKSLIDNGVKASINESIDFETAAIIGAEFNVDVKIDSGLEKKSASTGDKRPPIVTIMGHVDHGKTTLLDAIRSTDIASKESGGITQHIGAYQVSIKISSDTPPRTITFLDTPGHEAFSALRAHGASLTDIVILVVAADDGVKPQTLEAIAHARAAGVPIIVAINKIDVPGSDPEKVKRELTQQGLTPEDWGGDIPMVEVSAKKNLGLEQLLEIILLVADINDIRCPKTSRTEGITIDSKVLAGAGPVATILVKSGILKVGDTVVVGSTWGKIKFMQDWRGERITMAKPSTPVIIAGLSSVPSFAEILVVVENDKKAREIISSRQIPTSFHSLAEVQSETKKLNIIARADVTGSIEALKSEIREKVTGEIKPNIIFSGVGDVSESDILMASVTKSVIINYRVNANSLVRKLAKEKKVSLFEFNVIYEVIEKLNELVTSLKDPEVIEVVGGKLKILAEFFHEKDEAIIGGEVLTGKIEQNQKARIYRGEEIISNVRILQLKIDTKQVKDVKPPTQCGLQLIRLTDEPLPQFQIGDKLESYFLDQIN